jgi:hypothetical protein
MIIFYPTSVGVTATGYETASPVVVLDALDSSDRYTDAEVLAAVYLNDPGTGTIMTPSIFSCSYEFEFMHNGIPLGESLKTHFIGSIVSPPSALVSQLSPKYFTSAQSTSEMSDAFSNIANPQSTITHACIVVKDPNGNYIYRPFIAYAAQTQPDIMGSTSTLVIHGAAIEDKIINSSIAFVIDKTLPLSTQLSAMLTQAGYTAVFKTTAVSSNPVADKLFPPLVLNELLDEICLQNKLVYSIFGKVVTFYSQTEKPTEIITTPKFSFLGYTGSLAWALGVENYANIIFKTSYFDAKMYQPITIYNDIKNAVFSGMVKNGNVSLIDSYDANIIRYVLRRSSEEIVMEITATNNWLLAQMRVDGLLESSVYGASL